MIRNRHRNDWLTVDDYSGFVRYRSQLSFDEYGFLTERPDIYNQQKSIRAFSDPYPVNPVRPNELPEAQNYVDFTIGVTNVPVNKNSIGWWMNAPAIAVNPLVGEKMDAVVGYSFVVY